ncbi:MAG: ATP synthase F1 subunit gamma [Deltaproteobacteria bacterium]|nr:ATP synthase F1 subunit gamma [Deltaproteobacteria bacterium]
MSSLKAIRKRIKSVKSSEKITKAMKMVAASKLRKAQDEVRAARPYAEQLDQVVGRLVKRLEKQSEAPHPLLDLHRTQNRIELLVLTSDRGLCGAFNANIIKKAQGFLRDMARPDRDIRISTLGHKGYEALSLGSHEIRTNYDHILEHPSYLKASEVAEEVSKAYIEDNLDSVYLVYNEFKSAISQKVVVKRLLPIMPAETEEDLTDYIYEPSQKELLDHLLPKHLATQLFQSFLESVASEHGARMSAMDNATRNAKEVITSLTIKYNRARQASITSELVEIISGAEALA